MIEIQTLSQLECAAVARMPAVDDVLEVLTRTTGLRMALVARVSDRSWTCCAIRDGADFGLEVGDVLDVATTY